MTILTVRDNIKQVQRELDAIARDQVPFAAALAITRTAKILDRELAGEVRGSFENPTPYVTRSTFSTSAKKTDLTALVGIRDKGDRSPAPSRYLFPHFFGGDRGLKPFELALQSIGALPQGMRAVPGAGIKLDRFGNPGRQAVVEVIGALKRGISVFKGRGKRVQLTGYFVRMPGDTRAQARHLEPGIWRRIGGDAVIPVFLFVEPSGYQKVFDLPKLGQEVVTREFPRELASALDRALRTAR